MSLQLKYNLCVTNNCTQIKFTEETGLYNSITNTTGWGTPNASLTDVVSAILTIKGPNGITYNIDLLTTTLFPSDTNGIEYTLPLSGYGNPTSITDGQWYFVYTVTMSNDDVYTKTIYKYFDCNSECCVTQMLANLDLSCDCCKDSTEYKEYILTWTQLQSLKKAAACGDETNFTAIKKIIDKLCLNSGCKTCN